MRMLFIIFLGVIALLISRGSSDNLQMQPEEFDTTPSAPIKLCALTFDDGPDIAKTALVLDKLDTYHVVATFFVVGMRVNKSTQPIMQRAISMGCEYGNHSFGYESMTAMTSADIIESVEKTSDSVEKYAGVRMKPKFFRPPNLAVNNTMYEAIDLPFAEGVLGFDWQGGAGNTPEKVANYVLSGMRDGAIILLHDVQPDPHPTPEALDILIPALKDSGYTFVTLNELFIRKGIDPRVEYKMWKYVE